ncbi:MAG: T9SS type A sorting domain-containing protein, partial [Bacteroidales bacterium]|nr:T9SS type A sorting domain-containing protein [Bacteroidales bacterium]
ISPDNTIELNSAIGTNSQTKCINTAITEITYTTTGATGVTFNGLPAGVMGSWGADVVTISGMPSVSGTFSYTVTLVGGCGSISETGTITVIPNSSITSVTGISPLCISEAVTYSANEVVLGGGVGDWSSSNTNVATVGSSGLVSAISAGSCDIMYTITGGCGGTVSRQQLININPVPIGGEGATSICSNVELSYDFQTDNLNVLGNSQLSTFSWMTASNPNVTGESTAPQTTGIINDNINNVSGVDQTVVYTVTPTGTNGCVGNPFTVTVTVKPEPVGEAETAIICSDVALSYNLQTANINVLGNGQPSTFSWIAEFNSNVSGESTTPQTTGIINDNINNISGVDQVVVYTVIPTGTNGCVGNPFSVKVTINTIPTIVVKWGDVLICPNVDSLFSNYQWIKGTTPIPGANKQYYVTNKQPGTYIVETIDKNGCKNSSNEIAISGSKALSVYPNPASKSFTLKFNNETEGRAVISILNSSGIKVMEFQIENVNDELLKEIPVNNLDEGIYVIQILLNNKDLYYEKIIIVK